MDQPTTNPTADEMASLLKVLATVCDRNVFNGMIGAGHVATWDAAIATTPGVVVADHEGRLHVARRRASDIAATAARQPARAIKLMGVTAGTRFRHNGTDYTLTSPARLEQSADRNNVGDRNIEASTDRGSLILSRHDPIELVG